MKLRSSARITTPMFAFLALLLAGCTGLGDDAERSGARITTSETSGVDRAIAPDTTIAPQTSVAEETSTTSTESATAETTEAGLGGAVPAFSIEVGECTVEGDAVTLFATNTGSETNGFSADLEFLDAENNVLGTQTMGELSLRPAERTRLTELQSSFRYGTASPTPATTCRPVEVRQADSSIGRFGATELDPNTFACEQTGVDGFGDITGAFTPPPSAAGSTVQLTVAWMVRDLRIGTSFYTVQVPADGPVPPLSTFVAGPPEGVVCEIVEVFEI